MSDSKPKEPTASIKPEEGWTQDDLEKWILEKTDEFLEQNPGAMIYNARLTKDDDGTVHLELDAIKPR